MNLIPTYTLGAKLVLTSVKEPWQKVFEVASIKISDDSKSVSYKDRNGHLLNEFFDYYQGKKWRYDPFGQDNFYVSVAPYFGSETLLLPEHLVPQLVGVSVRVEIPATEGGVVSFMANGFSYDSNGVVFKYPDINFGGGRVNSIQFIENSWTAYLNSHGVNQIWLNNAKVYLKS